MNRQFQNDSEEDNAPTGEGGSSRVRLQLLVLILLVAAFGYIYFFTGLVRPKEEAPPQPPVQTAEVRKPMPQRPAQPEEAAKPTEQPAKPQEAKPAPPAAPVPAKPEQPKPPQPPAAKGAPAVKEAAKTVPAAAPSAKPAVQPKEKAPPPAAKAPRKVETKAEKGTPGKYTLLIGEYVAAKSVNEVKAKVKKAGLAPVVAKGRKKTEPMNRLFMADFADEASARAELAKLKKLTGGAFILPENGRYAVYAGSYFLAGAAAREQDRLYGLGVKLVMRRAEVPVSTSRVTAGSFPTREKAQEAAARLKKQGLKASVVPSGA